MSESLHPPGFCPIHGIFPVVSVGIQPGRKNIRLHDLGVDCPWCGQSCEVIPGVYDSSQSVLNILLDESISPEALSAIRGIAERLQRGELTLRNAKVEAERLSPKAARIFDFKDWSGRDTATACLSIIAIVTTLLTTKCNPAPTTVVNIQPVIERVVDVEQTDLKTRLRSSGAIIRLEDIPPPPIKPERLEDIPPPPKKPMSTPDKSG